jgi:hypothetical protein
MSVAVLWPRGASVTDQKVVTFDTEAEAVAFVNSRLLRADNAYLTADQRPLLIPVFTPAEAEQAVPSLVAA